VLLYEGVKHIFRSRHQYWVRLVKDGRRYYTIIEARPGEASYNETELHVGPVLLKTKPAELAGLAQFRLRVARKALSGAENGGEEAVAEALRSEIRIWEGVEACL